MQPQGPSRRQCCSTSKQNEVQVVKGALGEDLAGHINQVYRLGFHL